MFKIVCWLLKSGNRALQKDWSKQTAARLPRRQNSTKFQTSVDSITVQLYAPGCAAMPQKRWLTSGAESEKCLRVLFFKLTMLIFCNYARRPCFLRFAFVVWSFRLKGWQNMFLIPFYAILRQSSNHCFWEFYISLLFSALFPTINGRWMKGLYPSNTPPAGSRCESHHTQGISIVLLRITFLPLGITYADEPGIVLFIVHLNHPRLNTGKPDIFKIEFCLLFEIFRQKHFIRDVVFEWDVSWWGHVTSLKKFSLQAFPQKWWCGYETMCMWI